MWALLPHLANLRKLLVDEFVIGHCSFLWLLPMSSRPSSIASEGNCFIFLVGPQGDSATVAAGLASWKSDKPALQRPNRWASFSSSFITVRERPSRGSCRRRVTLYKGALVKFTLQGKQYYGGVIFSCAVAGMTI